MNWISVKDRLPENDRYVFVVLQGLLIDNLCPKITKSYYSYRFGWKIKNFQMIVTHWMDFPEIPSEVD